MKSLLEVYELCHPGRAVDDPWQEWCRFFAELIVCRSYVFVHTGRMITSENVKTASYL
jgi:hypothetical protein